MTAALLLIGGLIGLVVSGALIVQGAAGIGTRLGLSPLVVGLTIVAAGTSAPELAVVWRAADRGDPELAIGSVVGSNIANILLVLGLVAIVGAVPVTRRSVRIDVPLMIAASLAVWALSVDGGIGRIDGLLLVGGLVVYLVTVVVSAKRRPVRAADPVEESTLVDEAAAPAPLPLGWAIARFAVGALGVAGSAQLVVSGAEELALALGIPELVVGLTVLAVGTSAPEIATSVIAAVRGHRDVALGNAIGSNIFNLLFVLGTVALVHDDLSVSSAVRQLDLPVMVGAAILVLPFALTRSSITRWEGAVFVACYAAYTSYLVLDAIEHGFRDVVALTALGGLVPAATAISVWTLISVRRRRDVTGQRVDDVVDDDGRNGAEDQSSPTAPSRSPTV